MEKSDAPFFVLFDFILKINSEHFISLSAPVGKTKSPASVLAVGSLRKCSFSDMASGKAHRCCAACMPWLVGLGDSTSSSGEKRGFLSVLQQI